MLTYIANKNQTFQLNQWSFHDVKIILDRHVTTSNLAGLANCISISNLADVSQEAEFKISKI